MSLRVAIVEDSQENIDILKYMIERCAVAVDIIGIARTKEEAVVLLSRDDVDVALLDIQLKKGTIFEVLEDLSKIKKINFETIFITAHGSYENALKAIRYACLDFINKPIDEDELHAILEKVNSKVSSQSVDSQLKQLLHFVGGEADSPDTIGIILPKGIIEFVPIHKILYMEADQTICRIFLSDDSKFNSSKHFGYYLDLLADHPSFIQSSKSHLVNMNHIKQYNHRERTINFENGSHLIASFR